MNENRLMQQVGTIFGAFMVLFYLGIGFYLILSPDLILAFNPDYTRFFRFLVGGTFIIYGIYRAYRTYVKVKEVFFQKEEDERN
jgi:Ca2+/Na+ antiporter